MAHGPNSVISMQHQGMELVKKAAFSMQGIVLIIFLSLATLLVDVLVRKFSLISWLLNTHDTL